MSSHQDSFMFEESYLDKSLKYDYHGNKYSLFIGGLDPGTSEVEIVKKIENIGVTDLVDAKIQRNKFLESKRYAEVHLFSIESVKLVKLRYPGKKNVFPFNAKSKKFLEDYHLKKLYLVEKFKNEIQVETYRQKLLNISDHLSSKTEKVVNFRWKEIQFAILFGCTGINADDIINRFAFKITLESGVITDVLNVKLEKSFAVIYFGSMTSVEFILKEYFDDYCVRSFSTENRKYFSIKFDCCISESYFFFKFLKIKAMIDAILASDRIKHLSPSKNEILKYLNKGEKKFLTDLSKSIKKWISISLNEKFGNKKLHECPPTIELNFGFKSKPWYKHVKKFIICFKKKNYSLAGSYFDQFSGELSRICKGEVEFCASGLDILSCFPGERIVNQRKKKCYAKKVQGKHNIKPMKSKNIKFKLWK